VGDFACAADESNIVLTGTGVCGLLRHSAPAAIYRAHGAAISVNRLSEGKARRSARKLLSTIFIQTEINMRRARTSFNFISILVVGNVFDRIPMVRNFLSVFIY
jgi:hypothetical protein